MADTENGFVYMKNDEIQAETWVPDEDGVVEWHEARGWAKAEPPEEVPFVPSVPEVPDTEATWITLRHPKLGNRTHDFPNNPDALQGALDAGWELIPAVEPEPEPEPPMDTPPEPPAAEQASARAKATTKKEGK